MAERNDVADAQFPQPQAPEIVVGLPDVQQGEPAALEAVYMGGGTGRLPGRDVFHPGFT